MLSVWLPLNGDVKNQGLMDISPQAVGSGTWENGKIGKCYNGTGNGYINLNASITMNGAFSIALWIKVNSFNSAWARIFGFYKNVDEYLGMCYSNTNTIGFHMYDSVNGTKTGLYDAYRYTPIVGEWSHITLVFDGIKTMKWYKDGNLLHTDTNVKSFAGDIYTQCAICSIGNGNNKADCSLNDFRIYDHALSPREVKEISKGLVLHYSLSMPGQENLIEKSSDFTGWSINSIFTINQISTGQYIASASRTGATSNVWSRIIPTVKLNPELYPNGVTVSFDFKCDDISALDHKCICALQIYNSSNTRIGWYEYKNTFTEVNYVGSTTLKDGVWKRLSCYFTQSNLKTVSSSGYTVNDISYTMLSFQLVKNGSISFKHIKLEEGSHPTPWMPNPADTEYSALGFNDGIEYDVSGYGNNGTKVGSITYDADTPRYETSAVFDGSSDIRSAKSSFGWFDFKEGTVAAWFKPANTTQTWASVGVQNDGGTGSRSFSICNDSGKAATVVGYDSSWGYLSSDYSMSANVWYHLCATITNGDTVKLYVNGELVQTRTVTNTTGTIASTTQFAVGVDLPGSDERFTGHLSDVRFYTTYLKESDVRELYNTSMSLSNNGVLFGYEFIE